MIAVVYITPSNIPGNLFAEYICTSRLSIAEIAMRAAFHAKPGRRKTATPCVSFILFRESRRLYKLSVCDWLISLSQAGMGNLQSNDSAPFILYKESANFAPHISSFSPIYLFLIPIYV